tara:strand:+ start:935 stop:1144 length:210 start_codon:yes stop_codon:yes gene_type:complete
LFFKRYKIRLNISKIKIELINGLTNLSRPLGSIMEDSKKIIEIIGANDESPGLINHKDPKIPRIIGIKK